MQSIIVLLIGHFHDLRHTATTALVDEGVDIRKARTRFVHSEQALLRIYSLATAEGDRRTAEAVGEQFRPRDGRPIIACEAGHRDGKSGV